MTESMKTNQLRNSWTLRTGPRRKRLASSVILVVVGLLAATFEGVGGPAANAQQSPEWLTIANAYRTSAGLPAVTADPALQAGVDAHVKYLAATGSLSHVEATSQPLYTPEGDLAAQQSILAGWTGPAKSDRELIDGWMTAPFHSIHLFEPRLRKAAYAVQRDPGSALSSAAVMNIIGGIGPKVALGPVIVFPARDSVTPLTSFLVEAPNPLTNCPGYVAPSGMGILALFPKPIPTATVTMTANGAPVESCTIDANYKNPDPAGQATVIQIGRAHV